MLCNSVIDAAEFGNDRGLSANMFFLSGLQHVYCGDVLRRPRTFAYISVKNRANTAK
jgi:hypothetical protein